MARSNKLSSGILTVIGWCVLGGIIGVGVGYFVYVKKPAVFESNAAVQITRATTVESPAVAETADDPGLDRSASAVDDAALIQSERVLARAVTIGRLDQLPEFQANSRGRNPREIASSIVSSGRLNVQQVAPTSLGAVYELRFRGTTPTSSKEVLDSIVSSCQRDLAEVDTSRDWEESMNLLKSMQVDVNTRLDELNAAQVEKNFPADATLQQGEVVSKIAEEWQLLRGHAYQLQAERLALDRKLRRTQSLVAQGASSDSILQSLGEPVRVASRLAPVPVAVQAPNREEVQRRLAERNALIREVEKNVAPLQRELDSLLKKLGPKHPTVVSVNSKIVREKSKLRDLPPLEGETHIATIPPEPQKKTVPDAGSSDEADRPTDGEKIGKLLGALRTQREEVADELATVSASLGDAAEKLANQEQVLHDREKMRQEIGRQEEAGEQIQIRLERLVNATPFPSTRFSVIRTAAPGNQVEPILQSHLLLGGATGFVSGFVLSLLILLTAVSTKGEPIDE